MKATYTIFEQGSQQSASASSIGPFVAGATPGFVWIHLDQPDAAQISEVAGHLKIPAEVARVISGPHQRPTLLMLDSIAVVVLKVSRPGGESSSTAFDDVFIVLGHRFVLTMMWSPSTVMQEVERRVKAEVETVSLGSVGVLVTIASCVINGYEERISAINSEVDVLEAHVFGSGDADHSEQIYLLKRRTAEFRRSVVPLARGLERLARTDLPWLLAMPGPVLQGVLADALSASEDIEGLDLLLNDVLQANVARVTAGQNRTGLQQNEDTRKISAWAAIALIPTMVTGVYGMNFTNMPELQWKYGYLLALVAIVILCLIVHRLFRRNDWL